MAVHEIDQIDGMGRSEDGKQLIFLISDHLDWKSEGEHLLMLQEKINAYLAFIESEQYREHYQDGQFEEFIIEIHFLYPTTEKCDEFLAVVGEQLHPHNIFITTEISGEA
ncbi:DUF6572 domain-containing protein [Sporosarcina cyprini]|uniref:DUF6572 domain-containing protein n=1 Tax=Sporosarcina cyprini TaxID=2910523 RepID=UPI001EDCCE6E|nr:DUF6572 domain-containing protein [Sporosarcina cyprini]MCG3087958.1 hypothetical protein [Sporosarcina cyprini]